MITEHAAPHHFRYLAQFLAGRRVDVAAAPEGECAYTDGQTIYVSANADPAVQRREVLIQGALLGAGSLDGRYVARLRARPPLARRYLTLEGDRVLAQFAPRVALRGRPLGRLCATVGQFGKIVGARCRQNDACCTTGLVRDDQTIEIDPVSARQGIEGERRRSADELRGRRVI